MSISMKTNIAKQANPLRKQICIRLSASDHMRLERRSQENGVSTAEFTRQLIQADLETALPGKFTGTAKAIISDEHLLRILCFAVGSALAQTVGMKPDQMKVVEIRATEVMDQLRKYL